MTLSLIILTKNEAANLRVLLPAVRELADEIIVYDSGSDDDSAAVAAEFGARFISDPDWQGFGRQRQKAQAQARGDWILMLDADEVPDATLAAAIKATVAQPPAGTVYGLRRVDELFGAAIDYPSRWLKAHWRLYPKRFGYDDARVHESLRLADASTEALPGFLRHRTAPTPQFWLAKRFHYAAVWAEERAARGKNVSLLGVLGHSLGAFFKQYFWDGRFLCGRAGWLYSWLFVQYTFNKYALLYDRRHRPESYRADFQPHDDSPPGEALPHREPLSVVLITKNEQRHLAHCLASVQGLADDIVVLDSGSDDDTLKIAKRFGARCFTNTDWPGFGLQRQRAQALARHDWLLMLDADEALDAELRASIAAVLATPPPTDRVYAVARRNIFCGRPIHRRYHDAIDRLYHRRHFHYRPLAVHESLDRGTANVEVLGGHLLHYTNDNLQHFLAKNLRYSQIWGEERPPRRRSLALLPLRALVSFLREYFLRGAYHGGAYGFFLAAASGAYTFNKYLINHFAGAADESR